MFWNNGLDMVQLRKFRRTNWIVLIVITLAQDMCWNIEPDKVQLHKRSGTNRKVLTVITLTQNIRQINGTLKAQIRVNTKVISITHIRVV